MNETLTTAWRWMQATRKEIGHVRTVLIDGLGAHGYIVTFTALEAMEPIDPVFWAGNPALLTRFATEDGARTHPIAFHPKQRWHFPDGVACLGVRLYHQSSNGYPYTIREMYPVILPPHETPPYAA